MPMYDVEHTTPLTSSQRDALAKTITHIHSETFTTPKLFVNVRFVDLSQRKGEYRFVAGKEKHATNRIIANVRPSSNRTQAMWDDVCNALTKAWNDIVVTSSSSSPPSSKSTTSSSPPSDRKRNSFLSNSPPDFKDLRIANGNSKKSSSEDTQLRGIFILGTIIAGQEVGVSLPAAGEDRAWMKENMEKFRRLVKEGDEEIKDMLEEIEERGLMK